jgi:anti-sigma factor RsiW
MSDQQTPVSEEDLHAYVDGALSEERREQVERALEQNPALAAKVSDYFSLNSLFHDRYDRVLSEPVPARLRPRKTRSWREAMNWPQFAGMAAALVLGIGIGVGTDMGKSVPGGSWMGMGATSSDTRPVSADSSEMLARRAAIAHVVYMPAVSRPSDLGQGHEEEFVQLLANKLGTDVHPPMLTKSGFQLDGGRMLPGKDGPMAQFMYRNAQGERVTLVISHRNTSSNTTAFKLYQDGPVNVFYWVDGNFGYAVSGGLDRDVMLQLAHDVYSQLTGTTAG